MSLAAIRFSRIFRLAALAALWALLLPALVPLVHAPATVANETQPICHISLNGDHQHAPYHGKAQPSCPICQGLGSLAYGFVPPDVVALPAHDSTGFVPAAKLADFVVFTPSSTAWPRAPPVLA